VCLNLYIRSLTIGSKREPGIIVDGQNNDIACITETSSGPAVIDIEMEISGFKLCRNDRDTYRPVIRACYVCVLGRVARWAAG